MAFKLPPPPVGNEVSGPAFRDWFYKLQTYLNTIGSILFTELDFTGSNITSIQTRNHNDLQNIQGGDSTHRYHLSEEQYNKLTSGQVAMPGQDGEDGQDNYIYINQTTSSGGGGTGLTHPQVLTRVSFRM